MSAQVCARIERAARTDPRCICHIDSGYAAQSLGRRRSCSTTPTPDRGNVAAGDVQTRRSKLAISVLEIYDDGYRKEGSSK